jgi:hypothetical protein
MNSSFLKMLKAHNPDKEYPSNTGQKWTHEEEIVLLDELSKNLDIDSIAQLHNRTIGGINARRKVIAYNMYNNNTPIDEILLKTKLDKEQLLDTIERIKNSTKVKIVEKITPKFCIENEIKDIKNDIKDIKNTIKELVGMLNAVYEFETT